MRNKNPKQPWHHSRHEKEVLLEDLQLDLPSMHVESPDFYNSKMARLMASKNLDQVKKAGDLQLWSGLSLKWQESSISVIFVGKQPISQMNTKKKLHVLQIANVFFAVFLMSLVDRIILGWFLLKMPSWNTHSFLWPKKAVTNREILRRPQFHQICPPMTLRCETPRMPTTIRKEKTQFLVGDSSWNLHLPVGLPFLEFSALQPFRYTCFDVFSGNKGTEDTESCLGLGVS